MRNEYKAIIEYIDGQCEWITSDNSDYLALFDEMMGNDLYMNPTYRAQIRDCVIDITGRECSDKVLESIIDELRYNPEAYGTLKYTGRGFPVNHNPNCIWSSGSIGEHEIQIPEDMYSVSTVQSVCALIGQYSDYIANYSRACGILVYVNADYDSVDYILDHKCFEQLVFDEYEANNI